MSAKLIIDLGKVRLQEQSAVRCSYKHHPQNRGFDALLETIRFAMICRRCEGAPCVTACPRGALEKVPSTEQSTGQNPKSNGTGILRRANMLCTGCGTCAAACPFGTVDGDLIAFATSVCDVCRGRLQPKEEPLCVQTCRDGGIEYGEPRQSDDTVEVLPDIVVKVADGSTWKPILKEKEEAKQ